MRRQSSDGGGVPVPPPAAAPGPGGLLGMGRRLAVLVAAACFSGGIGFGFGFGVAGQVGSGSGHAGPAVSGAVAGRLVSMGEVDGPRRAASSDTIASAFDGDLSGVSVAVRHRITGDTTLGQPEGGYRYTPETSPHYTFLQNESGHNRGTDGNAGRTSAVAYRTKVMELGQGDAAAYNASVFVRGRREGPTHCLANAAGSIINGSMHAGNDGVYLNPGEWVLRDRGFDIATIGWVVNLDRNNATGALGAYWAGYAAQSVGRAPVDDAFAARGRYRVGVSLARAELDETQAAVALRAGQRIYGNAAPLEGDLFKVSLDSEYFAFDRVDGWIFVAGDHAKVALGPSSVSIGGQRVLGSRVTGFSPGVGKPLLGGFDSEAASPRESARRLLAIEQALRSHGLID